MKVSVRGNTKFQGGGVCVENGDFTSLQTSNNKAKTIQDILAHE